MTIHTTNPITITVKQVCNRITVSISGDWPFLTGGMRDIRSLASGKQNGKGVGSKCIEKIQRRDTGYASKQVWDDGGMKVPYCAPSPW